MLETLAPFDAEPIDSFALCEGSTKGNSPETEGPLR